MRAAHRFIAGESDKPLSFSKAPETSSTSGGTGKNMFLFTFIVFVTLIYDLYYGMERLSQECAYIRSPKTLLRRLTHLWVFSLLRWLTHGWGFSWEGWLMDGIFLTGSALLISLEPASSLPVCLWRWWGWTMTCWAVEWEEEWTYSKAEKVDSLMGFFTGSHILVNLQPTSSMPFKGSRMDSAFEWSHGLMDGRRYGRRKISSGNPRLQGIGSGLGSVQRLTEKLQRPEKKACPFINICYHPDICSARHQKRLTDKKRPFWLWTLWNLDFCKLPTIPIQIW